MWCIRNTWTADGIFGLPRRHMLGDIVIVVATCDTFILIAATADTTATIIGGIATVAAIISITSSIAAASGMVRRESIANIAKSGILASGISVINEVGIKKISLTFSRLLKAT